MFLLMVTSVFAITEGQIITQQQLDNQDIDSTSLQPQLESHTRYDGMYITVVSIFDIIPNGNDYKVIRKSYGYFSPPIGYFKKIKLEHGRAYMIQIFNRILISKVKSDISGTRYRIKQYQTSEEIDIGIEEISVE